MLSTALTLSAADRIAGIPAKEFYDWCNRLDEAAGISREKNDRTPTQEQRLIAHADKILDGYGWFYDREAVKIGKTGIDWSGKQKAHKEWRMQLNRFLMLGDLAKAYQITKDEKYPARARELIEDYIDYMEVKNGNKYFDACGNNPLNTTIRINNWILALRRMGSSRPFDDAFVEKMMKMLTRHIHALHQAIVTRTRRVAYNFMGAEADALTMSALQLRSLPEMADVLKFGSERFTSVMKIQFRPDGTQLENTCGYQLWMTKLAGKYRRLQELDKRLSPGITDDQLLNSLRFCYLTETFGLNDSSNAPWFPKFKRKDAQYAELCARFGLGKWKSPERQSFPDCRIYIAGDKKESLLFDATGGFAGHQHHARLNTLYSAYGYMIVCDYGTKDYELTSPMYRCGTETASHATVQPDDLCQYNRPEAARTLVDLNLPEVAVFGGVYHAGYAEWGKFKLTSRQPYRGLPRKIEARHYRWVVWLPGEYVLIRDRIAGKDVEKPAEWCFNFPTADQEKYQLDEENNVFRTENAKRPNFVIRLVSAPSGAEFRLVRYYGQKEPVWRGFRYRVAVPSPLLSFKGKGLKDGACADFLVAARPAKQSAPDYPVLRSEPGRLVLQRPDGGRDVWLDHASKECSFAGERVLLRYDAGGKLAKVLGIALTRYGERKFETPFTGFIAAK